MLETEFPREDMVIRDDSPVGEGKHAIVLKFTHKRDGRINFVVEEADPGFTSNDPMLQRLIDNYFSLKNKIEFAELEDRAEKEKLWPHYLWPLIAPVEQQ